MQDIIFATLFEIVCFLSIDGLLMVRKVESVCGPAEMKFVRAIRKILFNK